MDSRTEKVSQPAQSPTKQGNRKNKKETKPIGENSPSIEVETSNPSAVNRPRKERKRPKKKKSSIAELVTASNATVST
jgi:hypothetical protein